MADNASLPSKIALRRWFLQKYHSDTPPVVIDCCQGDGVLWGRLRSDFAVAGYTGFDVKPRHGRLAIDSARFLEAGGWHADVVDIDTYGHPWKHLDAINQTFRGDALTLFLTFGTQAHSGGVNNPKIQALSGLRTPIPKSLQFKIESKFIEWTLPTVLLQWTVVEARESPRSQRARYIGVRIARKMPAEAVTPAGKRHSKS